MRKVGACDLLIVELDLHPAQFMMWQAQEFIEHPQLMQQLQRRWMNGVAAKIAKEVPVFFKDRHLDAGAGKEQAEHHTGGAATNNTTRSSYVLRITLELAHRKTSGAISVTFLFMRFPFCSCLRYLFQICHRASSSRTEPHSGPPRLSVIESSTHSGFPERAASSTRDQGR